MSYQPENPGDSVKPEWIVRELSRVGSELYWEAVSGGVNYPDGKIGVGTATPSEQLHVVGNILSTGTLKLASLPTSPTGLSTGDVYRSGTTLKIV